MDIVCSDFLWSLFVGALNSYKHDSLLRPFPAQYKNEDGEKCFDDLKTVVSNIPQFDKLNWKDKSRQSSISLLKWVINPKRFTMKLGTAMTFADIKRLVGETENIACDATPDFVFEIQYGEQEETRFQTLRNNLGLFYAYHGSRTENFYSIIQTGLKNNLNKIALYGEGIYLSSDLRVSLTYSPISKTWDKSLLGDSLSCIAVCEVIDHPVDVKCSIQHSKKGSTCSGPDENQARTSDSNLLNRKRSFIKGSEGGEIPDKYYVVRNDDLVRVKYLLVHAPRAKKDLIRQLTTGASPRNVPARRSALWTFLGRHQFTFVMLLYAVILVLVGVLNSRAFSNWWRDITRKNEETSFFA
uniref:Poly [ADP-ribose] polymerase n=1 Tax=Phallusia mammillata TaxID=59560 RepID=A0A6F9DP37_9ASCI|nr:mono [ADP-ribose] polymerase PARP16 [Phallusia mammillata]